MEFEVWRQLYLDKNKSYPDFEECYEAGRESVIANRETFQKVKAGGVREGLEKAAATTENLYLPECHPGCIEPLVCKKASEAIRKEIDNDYPN